MRGGLQNVGVGDDALRVMHRRAQSEFLGLIERRIQHILLAADELDAIGAAALRFANRLARALRIVGRRLENLVEHRVHVDARRDDLVARAALLDPTSHSIGRWLPTSRTDVTPCAIHNFSM